jgi:hypothetical protein
MTGSPTEDILFAHALRTTTTARLQCALTSAAADRERAAPKDCRGNWALGVLVGSKCSVDRSEKRQLEIAASDALSWLKVKRVVDARFAYDERDASNQR